MWKQISVEHTSIVDIQNHYKNLKMKFIDGDFPPLDSSLYLDELSYQFDAPIKWVRAS
jgi:hypothetical protein